MAILKTKSAIFLVVFFILSASMPTYAAARQRIPILLYHHILSEEEYSGDNAFIMKAADFRHQMQFLFDNGYRTVSEDDMRRLLFDKERLPEKSFMIHFDDGYYSNIVYAYPILKEFGFNATIFLITELTEENDEELHNASYLSKKCMGHTSDVFTFASHTHAMHKKESGTTLLERSLMGEIIEDLNLSFGIVDNTFAFAYPHGQHSQTAINALKESGIEMAYTITKGYVTQNSNPFALNRFTVYRETSLNELSRIVANA